MPPGNSHQPAMCLPAGRSAISTRARASNNAAATTRSRGFADCYSTPSSTPWQFLNFLPLPHGHGWLRPTLGAARTGRCGAACGGAAARAGERPAVRRLRLACFARGTELRERRGFGVLRLQRAIEPRATRLFLALDLLGTLHLHVERREDRDGVELDALEHGGEQLEGLALVLVAIVLLRVAAQVDALAQVVHGAEMLAPLLVEHLEHDVLFDVPHDRLADALPPWRRTSRRWRR